VFTARYALSPYIKQIRFVFKGLINISFLTFCNIVLLRDVTRCLVYHKTKPFMNMKKALFFSGKSELGQFLAISVHNISCFFTMSCNVLFTLTAWHSDFLTYKKKTFICNSLPSNVAYIVSNWLFFSRCPLNNFFHLLIINFCGLKYYCHYIVKLNTNLST
jgi:hypothetical protein